MGVDFSLAEAVSPATSALFVVDMQNDGVHPDGAFGKRGWGVSSALDIVPTLKRLAEEARKAGVSVIFIRNVRSELTAWPALDRLSRQIMGDDYIPVCVEGTWGAEFYEGLEPQPGDIVVDKNRYSAFFGTNLDIILRNKAIKTLIMSGTATNVCVETTRLRHRHGRRRLRGTHP
jgi:ureidoacrylate peracid hydrolase